MVSADDKGLPCDPWDLTVRATLCRVDCVQEWQRETDSTDGTQTCVWKTITQREGIGRPCLDSGTPPQPCPVSSSGVTATTSCGAYVQVHQDKGTKAVCDEVYRIHVGCGGCGPNWGDLDKCKKLCTDTPDCNYLTFWDDNGCRVYRDCPKNTMLVHSWAVSNSSFKKRTCEIPEPVDCVQAWSDCTACTEGTRTCTWKTITDRRGSGQECTTETPLQQPRNCEMSVDCVQNWGDCTACTEGMHVCSWKTITPASGDGQSCSEQPDEERTCTMSLSDSSVSWKIATAGQSCTKFCQKSQMQCAQTELDALKDATKTIWSDKYKLAGISTCDNWHETCPPNKCASWGLPKVRTTGGKNMCLFTSSGRVANCEQALLTAQQYHQRLCPCRDLDLRRRILQEGLIVPAAEESTALSKNFGGPFGTKILEAPSALSSPSVPEPVAPEQRAPERKERRVLKGPPKFLCRRGLQNFLRVPLILPLREQSGPPAKSSDGDPDRDTDTTVDDTVAPSAGPAHNWRRAHST